MAADPPIRRLRVDAQRNLDALLVAARDVFAELGVDAPGHEIADRAGVGIGTMYRHFPRRSDLVAAVMAHEIDTCADSARDLVTREDVGDALGRWIDELAALVGTKQGLAEALHSGDPSMLDLAGYVRERLEPALEELLQSARASGSVRSDLHANEVISAVSLLSQPVPGRDAAFNQRLILLFRDGLRRNS